MNASLASSLASLPEAERAAILASLSDADLNELEYDWLFWARKNQIAPVGDWQTWLALAGRGFGKTEAGAQWVRERVAAGARSIALVAETQKDLEEVMVARLVSIYPPDEAPTVRYKPVRIAWPCGAVALGYNGTEPNQLRGPEFDTAWVDELAKYRYARDTWDMLQFTMRSGDDPRVFVTTTPRPIPVLREIIADPSTAVTRGSTFDNAANLPKQFLDRLTERYGDTRLGRQELEAEMLDDLPGALWQREAIDGHRVTNAPDMQRIVVAVDPSGTAGASDEGDSIGIVIAGKGVDGRGYILADRTCKLSPDGWGRRAVEAYKEFGADRIVAERNYGGAMVEAVIRTADRYVSYKEVTATRGKVVRAEPIAALYEQCVAGDSLIECERGPIPIRDVRPGDRVWTRAGLKPVMWSGQTGISQTMQIDVLGKSLRLTDNHPVFTEDGWVNAGHLAHKERMVFAWMQNAKFVAQPLAPARVEHYAGHAEQSAAGGISLGKYSDLLSSLAGCDILSRLMDIGALHGMAAANSFTVPFGKSIISARCLMGGMSTTLTATPATMTRPISWPSTQAIIRAITILMAHLTAGRGRNAHSAERGSLANGPSKPFALTSAGERVTPKQKGTVEPVYNLHVEGKHEYVANGILVHNCRVSHVGAFDELEDQMLLMGPGGYAGEGSPDRLDALVWALTELMTNERSLDYRALTAL